MTNAEAWFNKSLRPRKPEGSLGRTAQDDHLDSHTTPELCVYSLEIRWVSGFDQSFGTYGCQKLLCMDYSGTGEGATKHAASEPFGMFRHHMVTKLDTFCHPGVVASSYFNDVETHWFAADCCDCKFQQRLTTEL